MFGNNSHLQGVRHRQADNPRTQSVFAYHRENGSSENNTITQELQVHGQPPAEEPINTSVPQTPQGFFTSLVCMNVTLTSVTLVKKGHKELQFFNTVDLYKISVGFSETGFKCLCVTLANKWQPLLS